MSALLFWKKKKKYRYAQLMKIIRSGDFPAFGVKRCCLLLSPISLFSLSSAKRLFYVFLVFTETNLARLEIYTEITALLKQIVLLFEHTQGWKRLGQTVSIILFFSMFNVMATNKVFSYHSISISLLQYVSCVKKNLPLVSVSIVINCNLACVDQFGSLCFHSLNFNCFKG